MKASILLSNKLQDYNTFDNPENIVPVAFGDFKLRRGRFELVLPPFSVVVLEEQ